MYVCDYSLVTTKDEREEMNPRPHGSSSSRKDLPPWSLHTALVMPGSATCSDHHDSDSALSYHLVISVNISVPQSMHLTAQHSIFIALPSNYQHIKL